MYKTKVQTCVLLLLSSLCFVLFSSPSISQTKDPFEEFGSLMVDAIVDDDVFRVETLLKNQYIDPNGYTDNGKRIMFLHVASDSNSNKALPLILAAGARETLYGCSDGLPVPFYLAANDNWLNFDTPNEAGDYLKQALKTIEILNDFGLHEQTIILNRPDCVDAFPVIFEARLPARVPGLNPTDCPLVHDELLNAFLSSRGNINSIFLPKRGHAQNGFNIAHLLINGVGRRKHCLTDDYLKSVVEAGVNLALREEQGLIPLEFDRLQYWNFGYCRVVDYPNRLNFRSYMIAAGSPIPRDFVCEPGSENTCVKC